jgi:peptidoglycan hydrolase-like protein with peptidoglycan-binding domain
MTSIRMLKITTIIMLTLLVWPIVPHLARAHPGNTDSSGCHTCRTNCRSWGLSTGSYHCHQNKGVPQPSYPIRSHRGDPGYTEPWPDYASPDTSTDSTYPSTRSTVPSSFYDPYPYARGGLSISEVKIVQEQLASDSTIYPEGIVSGYYGPLTKVAIQRFQRKYGIVISGTEYTTEYGRFGPLTKRKFTEVFGPLSDTDPIVISLPLNAYWSSATDWSCYSGYQKTSNYCQALYKPPYSYWSSQTEWSCFYGYQAVGGTCQQIFKPANSYWSSQTTWSCLWGYKAAGNDCVALHKPDNAYWSGQTQWSCFWGYQRVGDICQSI